MLSMRARLIKSLLQHRNWLRLRPIKENVDWTQYEAILRFREEVERGAGKFGQLPAGIEVAPVQVVDIPAEWIRPVGARKDQVMLYFHGGGYVSGTCQSHRAIVSKFVKNSGVGALLFEYRLAPEHPYPAALEDALTSYGWLLEQGIAPGQIVFVGDSAGAGLVLATLLALRDKAVPLPAGAVAMSPVTDHTCSSESYRTKAQVCLSPAGMGPACARHYAGDSDLRLPYISPLYGDLQGLPPLLLYAGGDETLRDDSVGFAAKAQADGVELRLQIGEGLFHCYPAMAPLFPEARRAMDDICTFINNQVSK